MDSEWLCQCSSDPQAQARNPTVCVMSSGKEFNSLNRLFPVRSCNNHHSTSAQRQKSVLHNYSQALHSTFILQFKTQSWSCIDCVCLSFTFTFMHLADTFIQKQLPKESFTKVHRSLIITTRLTKTLRVTKTCSKHCEN